MTAVGARVRSRRWRRRGCRRWRRCRRGARCWSSRWTWRWCRRGDRCWSSRWTRCWSSRWARRWSSRRARRRALRRAWCRRRRGHGRRGHHALGAAELPLSPKAWWTRFALVEDKHVLVLARGAVLAICSTRPLLVLALLAFDARVRVILLVRVGVEVAYGADRAA